LSPAPLRTPVEKAIEWTNHRRGNCPPSCANLCEESRRLRSLQHAPAQSPDLVPRLLREHQPVIVVLAAPHLRFGLVDAVRLQRFDGHRCDVDGSCALPLRHDEDRLLGALEHCRRTSTRPWTRAEAISHAKAGGTFRSKKTAPRPRSRFRTKSVAKPWRCCGYMNATRLQGTKRRYTAFVCGDPDRSGRRTPKVDVPTSIRRPIACRSGRVPQFGVMLRAQ